MKTFIAKNPKQLDLCLKLMHVENVRFTVAVTQPSKHKIVYEIYAKNCFSVMRRRRFSSYSE